MIKPHVFSAVMDFFSTGLPVLTDEQPSPDTCELFYYVICLFVCCFTSQVNSYGHGGRVSSPNHTFYWASLNKL